MPEVDASYLRPNRWVDADHPSVLDYVQQHAPGLSGAEAAITLYYAVRDGFRYNPWGVSLSPDDYRASAVLARDRAQGAHCIDKALVLAAACRSLGIPSRLHYANVRNHIGTERLEKRLGTDLLVFHGYCELHLGGRWVAATPAFNRELCERLGVAPLDFDGVHDSVFQEYDPSAGRFMEYVEDHGTDPGVPFERMVAAWVQHYRFDPRKGGPKE